MREWPASKHNETLQKQPQRRDRVYNYDFFKYIFIEGLSESFNHNMKSLLGTKKSEAVTT